MPLGTTPDDVVCPACGGVYTAVVHLEGHTAWDFTRTLPTIATARPAWLVQHADGTACEVTPAQGRAAVAAGVAAMRRSA